MIAPFRLRSKKIIHILIPLCFTIRSINLLILLEIESFSNRIECILSLFLFGIILTPPNHFSKLKQESNHNLQIDNLIGNHTNHNH